MDVESKIKEKTAMPNSAEGADLRRRRRRKTCIISIWVVGVVVALAIVFTVLAFTVFKPKRPVATFNNISLNDVNFSFDILKKLQFLINITLLVDLSINNPNMAGFKYSETVAYLRYKGEDVGEAPIEGGEIGSKETKPFNLTMKLLADRMLFDPDAYSQALAGSLPLSTHLEIKGKVRVLFEITVTSNLTCNFNVDVMKKSLSNLSCHQETEM